MKPLIPSLKEKKRYILFKVLGKKLGAGELASLISKAGHQLLGELGLAKAGLHFLPETWNGETGIIRVGHKFTDEAKAVLALVKEVTITTIKTSGTIKKLKELRSKH